MDGWQENFAKVVFLRSSDTAHDLKTPLNIAVLNLELLRMRVRKLTEEQDDPKLIEYSGAIELELRRMARYRLRSERDDHTLNTTALVHEAYLRLVDGEKVQWNDRTHFLALASRMMRRILIDYANRRRTAKRGGGQPHVELDEFRLVPDERVEALLELDEALQRLEVQHPRPGQAIAHCYFGGLTNEEAAEVLGVSRATIERDLRFARAWLARHATGQRSEPLTDIQRSVRDGTFGVRSATDEERVAVRRNNDGE